MSTVNYISKILENLNMKNTQPSNTPMSSNSIPSKYDRDTLFEIDVARYRSMVSALQYISYTVNKLC